MLKSTKIQMIPENNPRRFLLKGNLIGGLSSAIKMKDAPDRDSRYKSPSRKSATCERAATLLIPISKIKPRIGFSQRRYRLGVSQGILGIIKKIYHFFLRLEITTIRKMEITSWNEGEVRGSEMEKMDKAQAFS